MEKLTSGPNKWTKWDLRLKFADRDAQDVASALVNTQEGGLYAEVKPRPTMTLPMPWPAP